MSKFENAILDYETRGVKYRTTGEARFSWRDFEPLGLLFGRFGYLEASLSKTAMTPLTYRLDLIEGLGDLSYIFEEPEESDFKEWAKESFGNLYRDELLQMRLIIKVVDWDKYLYFF